MRPARPTMCPRSHCREGARRRPRSRTTAVTVSIVTPRRHPIPSPRPRFHNPTNREFVSWATSARQPFRHRSAVCPLFLPSTEILRQRPPVNQRMFPFRTSLVLGVFYLQFADTVSATRASGQLPGFTARAFPRRGRARAQDTLSRPVRTLRLGGSTGVSRVCFSPVLFPSLSCL